MACNTGMRDNLTTRLLRLRLLMYRRRGFKPECSLCRTHASGVYSCLAEFHQSSGIWRRV